MHIVLVEDDDVIRETTQMSLERFGYTVTSFADGRDGYEFVTAHGADVVLLDLMLPTMNGSSICRAIREKSSVPVIVISARSDPIDIVQVLEAGADDYLTKPFDMQVLNARIRAVVRRFITAGTGTMGHSPVGPDAAEQETETVLGPGGAVRGPSEALGAGPATQTLTLGSLTIDTGSLTVELEGSEVHLTPTELRILMLLTEEPGHVYSREKIAYTVWGYQWAGDSRVVDVHIQRLRKKIGSTLIETVRGFGYRFVG